MDNTIGRAFLGLWTCVEDVLTLLQKVFAAYHDTEASSSAPGFPISHRAAKMLFNTRREEKDNPEGDRFTFAGILSPLKSNLSAKTSLNQCTKENGEPIYNLGKPYVAGTAVEDLKRVDVKIQLSNIPRQTVMTKDNVNVQIDSVLYWHVSNPYLATFGISNVSNALIERAQTTLRDVVGSRNLQSVIADRENVALQVEEIVENVAERWGVTVESILIKVSGRCIAAALRLVLLTPFLVR